MISNYNKEALDAIYKETNDFLIWGPRKDSRTEEEKFEDAMNVGLVLVDGKEKLVLIHDETKKGYAYGDYFSLKYPLEEIKYDSFVRWPSMMECI